MQRQGIIEPSYGPWSSPTVLVRKKDGSTRFCVDYRRLNDVTKKDCHPLPRIDTILDSLAGAQWFSTLDLKSGYWQVALEPADREKSAFCLDGGLWQFTVMPFGLCKGPATFERLTERVMRGLVGKGVLIYLQQLLCSSCMTIRHQATSGTKRRSSVYGRISTGLDVARPSIIGVNAAICVPHEKDHTNGNMDQLRFTSVAPLWSGWPLTSSVHYRKQNN